MADYKRITDQRPKTGELYRHFKNKMYQILAVARHSETGEELVIYQALYGDYSVYARPLAMFCSEVDHKKYPEVTQKYRFERIDRSSLEPACPVRIEQVSDICTDQRQTGENVDAADIEQMQTGKNADVADIEQMQTDTVTEAKRAEVSAEKQTVENEEEQADERLLRFLDTDTYQEKYEVLASFANDITDRLINDFAVIVDVVIPEGSLNERYEQLKSAIATKARYETGRLR